MGNRKKNSVGKKQQHFWTPLPKAAWVGEDAGVGVRPWGVPSPWVLRGLWWPLRCFGGHQAQTCGMSDGGGLEQQQQAIIRCVLGSFYQTEIILHCGAFKVTGSLRTLGVMGTVMLRFVR